jgi:hypothetical protein
VNVEAGRTSEVIGCYITGTYSPSSGGVPFSLEPEHSVRHCPAGQQEVWSWFNNAASAQHPSAH